jgi:uncharacterized membrane protein (UPF0127 family)
MDSYRAVIAVALLFTAALFTAPFIIEFSAGTETAEVCFSDTCVRAEVADTHPERSRGLMHRESLGEDEGMLFVFDTDGIYPFWMKNTFIPLDIVWIDRGYNVVHIEHAEPCRSEFCKVYEPNETARYVVEVNAGFTDMNSISVGDAVSIDLKH